MVKQKYFFSCHLHLVSFLPLAAGFHCVFDEISTQFYPLKSDHTAHSNNILAIADELCECVSPFCGIRSQKVNVMQ